MNILDILALIIIAFSIVTAVIKGLIREVLSLGSVILGLVLAVLFYQEGGEALHSVGVPGTWSAFLGFILIFIGIVAAGASIIHISDQILRALQIKWIDRLLGGLFGFLRGYLISLVIVLAFTAFPIGNGLVEGSRLRPFFFQGANIIAAVAPGHFGKRLVEGIEGIYQRLKGREDSAMDTHDKSAS